MTDDDDKRFNLRPSAPEEFENATAKKNSGIKKLLYYRNVTGFEKLSFQNVFRPH